MKHTISLSAALCAVLLYNPAFAKSDKAPTSIVLSWDHVVTGTIGDNPVSLVVDAATPDRPLLNPQFVDRINLGKSLLGGRFNIGPVNIRANTKVVKYMFDGLPWKRRSLWADRAYTEKYDGGVGPGGIPYDVVTLQLQEVLLNEKEYIFPLVENGNSVVEFPVGDKIIDITFTQKRDRSLATAAAGAVIAEQYDGAFTGESEQTEIAYGVERPIRALKLNKPVDFIGLSLNQVFVRTQDDGDSSGISDNDTPVDGSEIVVIGKRGKKDKNRYALTLGRDDLAHCSSITYDKPAKQVRLLCQPQ